MWDFRARCAKADEAGDVGGAQACVLKESDGFLFPRFEGGHIKTGFRLQRTEEPGQYSACESPVSASSPVAVIKHSNQHCLGRKSLL